MSARYTLYVGSKSISSWSLRPWLAMKFAGIAFTEETITLRTPDTKAQINSVSPSGKVPALRIEEGGQAYTVWDSLAICETIAERHPQARLWPVSAAARAEARSLAAEMHSGFPDVRKHLPMDFGRRHPTPEMDDALRAQIDRIIALWEDSLRRHPGGYLCGGFSIADCFFAPVVTRFETYAIALPEQAQGYAERVLALPAMEEWREAGLAGAPASDFA